MVAEKARRKASFRLRSRYASFIMHTIHKGPRESETGVVYRGSAQAYEAEAARVNSWLLSAGTDQSRLDDVDECMPGSPPIEARPR